VKKSGFSLKNAWYGLIALVSLVPVVVVLIVVGSLLFTTFLSNALQQESDFNELVRDHLETEVSRFITVLENKSDPITYALTRGGHQELIENLIGKVIEREHAIHTVLVLKPNGTIIAALESHDLEPGLPLDRPTLLLHWNPDPNNLPAELTVPMQGQTYISPPELHPEGVLFTITIPIGSREHPVAALLIEIDARMLWEALESRLTRENVKTYIVDRRGNLLNDIVGTSHTAGDQLTELAIVRAFVNSQSVSDLSANEQPWQPNQEYLGIEGNPVFGTATKIDLVNWGVITEVEKDTITQPIQASLSKIALGAIIITTFLAWLGLILVRRIARPISMLSKDFTRASQHDFSPTQVRSPIRELNTLVSGFNLMVSEIDASHRELRKNEAKFSGIIQVSKNAIISIDAEHCIVLFNPAAEQVFGYKRVEAIGQPLAMLLPTYIRDDHDSYITHFGKSDDATRDTMSNMAAQGQRKNGEMFPIEGSISKLELEDGLFYTIALTDITQRKKAKNQLHQAAVVFESTAEGVMIADANCQITMVNNAFTEITGYEQEEVLGKNPDMLHSGQHDEAFYKSMWKSIERTGLWRGEIWNRRKNGEIYPELLTINTVKNSQDKISQYVGVFSDISTIKDTEAKLAHLAHHDALTNLPNRLLFNARLEHALSRCHRDSSCLAVLFLDLDRFKNINDSLGHQHGDLLLQAVSNRLAKSVRDEDTVARLGGDEFIIFVEDLVDPQAAALVATNTLEQFSKPFHIEGDEVYVNASVGVSLYPENGKDVETLVKNGTGTQ
jgi:diguanylate cyclase (GGDEF)-like protein/PAS domain S-box-containing protein